MRCSYSPKTKQTMSSKTNGIPLVSNIFADSPPNPGYWVNYSYLVLLGTAGVSTA